MGMQGFERRLERMVEGAFARVFRSGLRPVELGRRLAREMDDGRTVDVRGRTIVPNEYALHLATEDFDRFEEIAATLCRELAEAAREHAHDEGYAFMGPVRVELVEGPKLRTGAFAIVGRFHEGEGGLGAGSLLLPDGERFELSAEPVVIGRLSACDISIADPNVSRRHAEIQPRGENWVLVDLGSTNGTRVNGVRVDEHVLLDGDEITIGTATITFDAS
jgi:hypothetical protein